MSVTPMTPIPPAFALPEDPDIERQIKQELKRRMLELYTPYPKQRLFHRIGGQTGINARLLMAGNQLGKTLSAAAETAMHATGRYPDWWEGKRFTTGIKAWVAGATSQTTRDNPQRLLMGEVGEWGTGMIPERYIVDIKKSLHGVPDAIETVTVKHASGTLSRITFKTYDQGRLRWQGETLDVVWYDEEPPIDIYSEGNTRLQVRDGISYMTFTPLLGMSEVVARFLQEKPPGSAVITMTIEEAEHYTPEQRAKIIAGYPAHEREARARGIPMMGSGRVFPIDENLIIETPVEIPPHWPRIAGLDIGWDHPTACVWMAWDRDVDCVHVYDSYKLKEQTPVVHAAAIKGHGVWIPVAWPHDGLQHEKGSGIQIANQYRTQGVNMLRFHATHAPEKGKKEGTGGYSLEAGVSEMLIRMQTGRLKVSMNLNDWREEFRLYHRKDGLIVKKNDDLMSATRVGCMMLRHASVQVFRSAAPKLKGFRQTDRGMGVLG